ncbi:hypothetical protein [uncultured Methanobrevibacter sp.]|uniref:hypothetical protein n=1 Tax=uncultured Methanobrevibacter sp. TaxID=253161 RepID=UPI0026223D23|nr:hypothetical protein [uncultured Methanobrevibacter sp.]
MPASFVDDYLQGMTTKQLRQKYNIGNTRCMTWKRHAYNQTGVKPRVKQRIHRKYDLPKYISINHGKYHIQRKIKGKLYYFGSYKTLDEAKTKLGEIQKK